MDVYQKVLVRLYEVSGGKDTADIDFVEELKKEGFYPSRESILEHMTGEGWIAETSRSRYVVRLTHWGSAAAKKLLNRSASDPQGLGKLPGQLLASAKEFSIAAEEFKAAPDAEKFKGLEQRLKEISGLAEKIKQEL